MYDIGDTVRITGTFTVAGVATDPTTIKAKVRLPSGAVTTYTYPTDAALVKDSTGVYHLDIPITTAGLYAYRWEGTGAAKAAEEATFDVEASRF